MTFPREFSNIPSVFRAISGFNVNVHGKFKCGVSIKDVTTTSMTYEIVGNPTEFDAMYLAVDL